MGRNKGQCKAQGSRARAASGLTTGRAAESLGLGAWGMNVEAARERGAHVCAKAQGIDIDSSNRDCAAPWERGHQAYTALAYAARSGSKQRWMVQAACY